jgi:hypothetical protein
LGGVGRGWVSGWLSDARSAGRGSLGQPEDFQRFDEMAFWWLRLTSVGG